MIKGAVVLYRRSERSSLDFLEAQFLTDSAESEELPDDVQKRIEECFERDGILSRSSLNLPLLIFDATHRPGRPAPANQLAVCISHAFGGEFTVNVMPANDSFESLNIEAIERDLLDQQPSRDDFEDID